MATVTTDRRQGINSSAAIKLSCVCATTGNITLSGEQTIDGIVTDETRVFVKSQTDTTEIGIYQSSTGDWTREPDWDGTIDIKEGTIIPVSRGTANSDTYWKITNIGEITVGTTAITIQATTVLSSAILNDGSVKMIADFEPNVTATYSLGVSTGTWTSVHLSSAVNANSAAISSNAVVGGTFQSSGTATLSSNATVGGTFQSSGTATMSSNATVGGTLVVTGASSMSSNATVAGTMVVSGASSMSSDVAIGKSVTVSSAVTASILTTALSGTDPGVVGQLWVSTSTGATAGKFIMVSTG